MTPERIPWPPPVRMSAGLRAGHSEPALGEAWLPLLTSVPRLKAFPFPFFQHRKPSKYYEIYVHIYIYIYKRQTPRHEVYKFESGSRGTFPKHGVQRIHFQRGQNWGSLLHPPSLLPDPQLSSSWELKGMWGRGQAGSWDITRTQVGLDPKVVPTLLERAGGPLLRWASRSLKREMRVPAPPPGSLDNVHGDLLRSPWTGSDPACVSERDIHRSPSTLHPTQPPSTALSRSEFTLTTGWMSDGEARPQTAAWLFHSHQNWGPTVCRTRV